MAEHPGVPQRLTELALAESPMLERFYVAGGGNAQDLRTDMSHALAAVLLCGYVQSVPKVETPIDLTFHDRRVVQRAYTGPDRRRARVHL